MSDFHFKYVIFFVFTVFVSGTQIGVKPTKIVAGHDPDKTNEFLQTLAAAINKKVRDWTIDSTSY